MDVSSGDTQTEHTADFGIWDCRGASAQRCRPCRRADWRALLHVHTCRLRVAAAAAADRARLAARQGCPDCGVVLGGQGAHIARPRAVLRLGPIEQRIAVRQHRPCAVQLGAAGAQDTLRGLRALCRLLSSLQSKTAELSFTPTLADLAITGMGLPAPG